MQIRKPFGAKLDSSDLPSRSEVRVKVIEDLDGLPSLQFAHSDYVMQERGRRLNIAISDLIYITEWAQKP